MSFLPPVVLEIRAQAAQFYAETAKVSDAVKAMADETGAAAAGMSDKVSADAAAMGDRVVVATEEMATKASAGVESMSARIIAEAEQMDVGTTTATEDMVRKVVMGFDEMSTSAVAAMERQAQATVSTMEATSAKISATEEKTAAAVEASTTAIVAALAEQGAASDKAATQASVSGLKMQDTFIKTAATAVSSTGTITGALVASSLKQAEAAKGAEASFMGVANGITKVALVSGLVIAGIGLDMAAHFQRSTNLLVTAGGESKNQLSNIRTEILNISADTGTSAEQLSEGMYVMEKAGYRGAAGLAALRASAEGAKAENVDLGTMTQATTDILLDYGYKMGNAKEATNSSVQVVNMLVAASGAAKVKMQDFAASMAAVVPIASSAKISFAEVGGAIATMTQHGQTAQQSSQNLANMIQALIRPNNMASAAMNQMGIDTVGLAQHLGQTGLSGALKTISTAVMDHIGPSGLVVQDTMKKSANATEALKLMLATMPPDIAANSQALLDGNDSIKSYTQSAKSMGGATGATMTQFLSLYKASNGVNDSLRTGQPAMMTYQAAMTKVLGNVTAARAATMLLMNGSNDLNRSIQLVTDAADKGGQHISTWGETQAQLSTQLDMAKQRSEALAINIGTALIPMALGALKGFEDLFDGFQKGNPVLLGLAGIIGGVVTLSVAAYTAKMVEAQVESIKTFATMSGGAIKTAATFVASLFTMETAEDSLAKSTTLSGAQIKSGLGTMAMAGAGIAIVAGGLALVGANSHAAVVPIQDMTTAMADLALKQGDVAKVRIDQAFSQWNTVMGNSTSSVSSLDGAIDKFTHRDLSATINDWADNALQPLVAQFGIVKGEAGQMDDKFKEVGDSLAGMVKGGQADTAAKGFDKIATSFENQGKSAQDALDTMPGYKQALTDMAAGTGQVLAPAELLDLAMGKVPDKMVNAATATQTYTDAAGNTRSVNADTAKTLDDMGVSIDGQITKLGNLYDAMVKTGLANLSARDAEFRFGDAVQKATAQADDLKAKLKGDLSSALNKTGTDFNKTTAAGQEAEGAFSNVAQTGLQAASVLAHDVTKGAKDVTGSLQGTYDKMVSTAEAFGVGKVQAENLTRGILGIPPGVSVKTWMDDYAKRMADQTKGAIDGIPAVKNVDIAIQATGERRFIDAALGIPLPPASISIMGNKYTGGLVNASGLFTGGMVPGLAGGGSVSGIVPGKSPANPHMDNILAMVNGKPMGLRSGEFVMNEPQTKSNMPWLKAMNAGMNMSDIFTPHTPKLAYASTSKDAQAPTQVTNNHSRSVSNSVVIHSTADPRSLAAEFSRMTANMM